MDSVPSRFRELNLKAFDKGFEYGVKILASGPLAEENGHEKEPDGSKANARAAECDPLSRRQSRPSGPLRASTNRHWRRRTTDSRLARRSGRRDARTARPRT
jgi:hypothetical protein